MSVDYVIFLTKESLTTVIYLLAPILGTGLAVGLIVGIFQAVTQIQELTLSFIPKMAIVGFVILALTPWFLDILMNYTQEMFSQIAQVGMQ
ncbi:MAG: flagellar biosynthesis protein FliQ [FCB group bacterium]|nr:flagellar biosynthesis protein FliQ [FCB group bacterium]